MRQFCVTTSMGKRLIGKAMVVHPDIKIRSPRTSLHSIRHRNKLQTSC